MKELTPINETEKISKAFHFSNIQNRHNFPRYDAVVLDMCQCYNNFKTKGREHQFTTSGGTARPYPTGTPGIRGIPSSDVVGRAW